MICDPGDAMTLQADDVSADWIDGAKVIHFEAWYLFDDRTWGIWASLARMARQLGITITLDACSASRINAIGAKTFLERIAHVKPDFLLCNESESQALNVTTSVPPGVGCTVIHRGEKPTQVISPRSSREFRLRHVAEAIDSCGAGDSFAAGFCSALVQGADVDDAIHAGHHLASIAVTQNGSLIRMDALSCPLASS